MVVMPSMVKGSNLPVSAPAVRCVVRWSAGPGVPDVDASALLLDERGKVRGDHDFIFYNQPGHPSGAVATTGSSPPPVVSPTRCRWTWVGWSRTSTGW